MAHEIEGDYAFFASNTPAWHGLGKILKDAPSIDAALKIAYPHNVLKMRAGAIITNEHGTDVFAESKDHVAIVRDDGTFLSFMGKDYEVVQAWEGFQLFAPLIESGLIELEAGGSLSGGKKLWVLAKVKDAGIEILPGDVVKGYLLLHTSFDGSLPLGFKVTTVRVVCANTLAQALAGKQDSCINFTARHTKGVHAKLENYRDVISKVMIGIHQNAQLMKQLARKQVSRDAQVKYIGDVLLTPEQFKQAEENKLAPQTMAKVVHVVDLLDMQMGLEKVPAMRGTAWQAYNAVSEYLTHEQGRTTESRLNGQWFGESARMNAKAMELALAM